jgi:phosphoenolpyruvate---glycerone phosphotransferase subunit DhaL
VRVAYEDVVGWIRAYAALIAEQKDELTRLDSAIGDGDHGINMSRGV